MNRLVLFALTLALLAVPHLAAAQESDGRIADVVKSGQRLLIVDEQGRRIEGRVDLTSAETVRVATRAGTKDIPVNRIVRIEKPDSLKNGALAGLGVGVSLGLFSAAIQTQGREAKWVLAGILSNGVACTLLGTGIDALFDNRRTLYERGRRAQARVSPIVGPGVRGAALSWNW